MQKVRSENDQKWGFQYGGAFLTQQQQIKMGKTKINDYDSVQFTGDWKFVKEKKEMMKVKAEKAVNSEFYLTFCDITGLYTFLYLSLAPEQAYSFQKIQPILQKMRGDDYFSQKQFQESRESLNLNWDNKTSLAELFRKNRDTIIKKQEIIHTLGSLITEDQAKQLIRSGLSQLKIHLDVHSSDGTEEEAIIPTLQNIDNCITVIFQPRNSKYLLALLSFLEEERQEKPAVQQKKQLPKKPWVIKEERPLSVRANNQTIVQRPEENKKLKSSTLGDQRILPPPQAFQLKNQNFAARRKPKSVLKTKTPTTQFGRDIKQVGVTIHQKLDDLKSGAMGIGRKMEEKVEDAIDEIKKNGFPWMQVAVLSIIAVGAFKVLKA